MFASMDEPENRPLPARSRRQSWSERELNALTEAIIGAAIAVHRHLGPGLLESVYGRCLEHELQRRGYEAGLGRWVDSQYEDLVVEDAFRADLEVRDPHTGARVLVELKAVERLHPVHAMQLLTFLRLSDLPLGLLINFNLERLKDGVQRVVNNFPGRST